MSIIVSRTMPTLFAPATKTNHVGSSGQFAQPAGAALAHLGGYVLGGPCAMMHDRSPTVSTGETIRFYAFRAPNCDALALWAIVGDSAQSTAKVEMTAGGGATREVEAYYPGTSTGTVAIQLMAEWDSGDSGYQEVVITGTDVGFYDFVVYPVYRTTLDSGEDCVVPLDESDSEGGLGEGQYIIESATSGIKGLIAETDDVWSAGIRTCAVWFGTAAVSVSDSAGWVNPFGTFVFKHRMRQKKAEVLNHMRLYAWTKVDGGVTAQVRATSSETADVVTSTDITHTSYSFDDTPLLQLEVDAAGDDTIEFEMNVSAGFGDIDCLGLCILEDS